MAFTRVGGEFWVELNADKPGMIGHFNTFNQIPSVEVPDRIRPASDKRTHCPLLNSQR